MKLLNKLKLTNYFTKREILGALLVIALFTISLVASYQYGDALEDLVVLGGPIGMIAFVLLTISSVVLAPMVAFPFLPIGVKLWGPLATSLLALAGWTIGSVIAFILAKKYGRPFAAKIIPLDRAESLAKKIVGKNSFWFIVLSRVVLPNDITSYAIGLFVPIKLLPYTIATIIGTAPLSFSVSYGVTLPPRIQLVIVLSIVGAIVIFVAGALIRLGIIKKNREGKEESRPPSSEES